MDLYVEEDAIGEMIVEQEDRYIFWKDLHTHNHSKTNIPRDFRKRKVKLAHTEIPVWIPGMDVGTNGERMRQ